MILDMCTHTHIHTLTGTDIQTDRQTDRDTQTERDRKTVLHARLAKKIEINVLFFAHICKQSPPISTDM